MGVDAQRRHLVATSMFRAFSMLSLTALILLLSSVGAPSALAKEAPVIEVGQPFPDLHLPTLEGEMKRVSDYRGQKVLLHVFASW